MKKISTVLVAAGFAIATPAMALAAGTAVNSDTNSSATMGTNSTSPAVNSDATGKSDMTTGSVSGSNMTAAQAITALQGASASKADLSGIQQGANVNIIDLSQLEQNAQGTEKDNLQQAVQQAKQSENLSQLQNDIKSNDTVSSKLQAQGFSASDVVAVDTKTNSNQVDVFVNKKSS